MAYRWSTHTAPAAKTRQNQRPEHHPYRRTHAAVRSQCAQGRRAPKTGAKCTAILEPLGDALKASALPPIHHESLPSLTFTSARTAQISRFIATRLLYIDEQALRREAWGETRFEREDKKQHWIHVLKAFIPFWGSLDDLQSDKPGTRLLGAIGLLLDIVSFAIPLGKFVAGSIRLAVSAGKLAIRAALPSMAQLSKTLLVSSLRNLNPLDAAPALLKLALRGTHGAVRAVAHAERLAVSRLKRLAGRSGSYDLLQGLPQTLEAGHWRPLSQADQLAVVKGIDDVPVRNVAVDGTRHHVLDPFSGQPYGPRLTVQDHDLSLGRSHYSGTRKGDEQIVIELPQNSRIEHLPEVDGRTTLLIDDVPYRLDGDELRRVDLLDESAHWTALPCRIRRAPGSGGIAASVTSPVSRHLCHRLVPSTRKKATHHGSASGSRSLATCPDNEARSWRSMPSFTRSSTTDRNCSLATSSTLGSVVAVWYRGSRFKRRSSFAKGFLPGSRPAARMRGSMIRIRSAQ